MKQNNKSSKKHISKPEEATVKPLKKILKNIVIGIVVVIGGFYFIQLVLAWI